MEMILTPRRSFASTVQVICLLGVVLLAGCSTTPPAPTRGGSYKPYSIGGKWYHPLPDAQGFRETGLASWYGGKFHGRKTASGEIYDMYAMTAAHKTLPLGTYVNVRNLNNQKQVVVRINDRGPFVRKRIIDLSYTAAKKLEVIGPGITPVEIQALGASAGSPDPGIVAVDYQRGNFVIQIGAFKNHENAQRLVRQLNQRYRNVHIAPYESTEGTFYRVRVGKCTSLKEAYDYERLLIQKGFADAFAVAEDF